VPLDAIMRIWDKFDISQPRASAGDNFLRLQAETSGSRHLLLRSVKKQTHSSGAMSKSGTN